MTKPAQPCRDCGGPKPAIRGRRYCDACLDKRQPVFARQETARALARSRQRTLQRATEGKRTRKLTRDAPAGQKWCPRCERFLPLGSFSKNKGKALGLSNYCTSCYSIYFHAQRLQKTYGLTLEMYEHLFEQQQGRCAICLSRPRARRLTVDHDHQTGEVRGLLCTRCNHKVIGAARESSHILRRAAAYLDDPPAISGVKIEELGDWEGIRLEAAAEEAERTANGGPWVAILKRRRRSIADAYVVLPLHLFADLIREDRGPI